MSFTATPHQILMMAIQGEQAGKKFYQTLSDKSPDPKIKSMCAFLAEQENEHQVSLDKMDHELADTRKECDFSIDVLAEMAKGIASLQESGFEAPEFVADELTVQRCLKIAIHIEKETAILYQMIQGSLMFHGYQDALHKMIREERKHAETLRRVLDVITGVKPKESLQSDPDADGETVEFDAIEKTIRIKKKVVKTSRKRRVSVDLFYLLLIIMCFIIITLVMIGPNIIMRIFNAVVSN